MKKIFTIIAVCCIGWVNLCAYAALNSGQGKPFNNIVIFGDSLTDNGNMYKRSLNLFPKSPPYYKGRFSNGPVWADIVANTFSAKNINFDNVALGGETVVFKLNGKQLPYNFNMAITDYEVATAFKDRSKTLFIVWLGSNDYLYGNDNPKAATQEVIKTFQSDIQRLIDLGGTNFMILNLPEIAKTPYGLSSDIKLQNNFRNLVMMHNLLLSIALIDLQMKNVTSNIHLFDIHKLFNQLLEDPSTHSHSDVKFKNKTNACWTGGYRLRRNLNSATDKELNQSGLMPIIGSNPALQEAYRVGKAAQEGVEPCANPDEYIFWDTVHPTTAVHTLLAERITKFIEENYTPETNV